MERLVTAPISLLVASVLVIGIPCGVAILRLNDKRWQEILSIWIRDQGHRLLWADYRVFRLGPFTRTSDRRHAVFYIALVQPDGMHRRAWVRLSDPFDGPVDGKVEVRWDT